MDNNQMEEKCSGVVKFFSFIGCIITLGIVLGTTIFFWKSYATNVVYNMGRDIAFSFFEDSFFFLKWLFGGKDIIVVVRDFFFIYLTIFTVLGIFSSGYFALNPIEIGPSSKKVFGSIIPMVLSVMAFAITFCVKGVPNSEKMYVYPAMLIMVIFFFYDWIKLSKIFTKNWILGLVISLILTYISNIFIYSLYEPIVRGMIVTVIIFAIIFGISALIGAILNKEFWYKLFWKKYEKEM